MMCSFENKVMVLFSPKTGSQTLHGFLRRVVQVPNAYYGPRNPAQPDYEDGQAHWHPCMAYAVKHCGIAREDLPNWRFATFWRDPIDRCLSGYAHHLRINEGSSDPTTLEVYVSFWQSMFQQYQWLTDQLFSGDERAFPEVNLNHEWFNFHDYDNEVLRLADWFGYTGPSPTSLGYHSENSEGNRLYVDDLTPDQIRVIINRYRDDYQLLESRGIMAPTRDLYYQYRLTKYDEPMKIAQDFVEHYKK